MARYVLKDKSICLIFTRKLERVVALYGIMYVPSHGRAYDHNLIETYFVSVEK